MKRETTKTAVTQTGLDGPSTSSAGGCGVYLYGTMLNRHLPERSVAFIQGIASQPVKAVFCRELAAIVSPVSLAEFEPTTVRARLQDAKYLEATLRSHEAVVRAVQLERTILPTRLGVVCKSDEELITVLEPAHDRLKAQLEDLEGCDEWGVKLYADRSIIRQRVASVNPMLKEMRQERSSAPPGRLYFLERQPAQALDAVTRQAVSDLAREAYDRLTCQAKAAKLSNPLREMPAPANELEVLRAAFIVPRSQLRAFLNEIHRLSDGVNALRYEFNGPLAPYCFSKLEEAKLPRDMLQPKPRT